MEGAKRQSSSSRGRGREEGRKTVSRAAIKLEDGGGHDDLASTGARRMKEK